MIVHAGRVNRECGPVLGEVGAAKNVQAIPCRAGYDGGVLPLPDPDSPLRHRGFRHPAVPQLAVGQFDSDGRLYCGVKDRLAVVHVSSGRSRWWMRGRTHESGPGSLQLKLPGDVFRDVERDGPARFQVVLFDHSLVRPALESAGLDDLGDPETLQLDPGDPRARPLAALHDAVRATGAPALAIEQAVAEALGTLVAMMSRRPRRAPAGRRAVARALEALHERVTEGISLDALAAHAGMDKFHLCRAFRTQVGLPPHAYLTHLRVTRARQLLARGLTAAEVATRVGFYDQSQLSRHFRRAVGMTPGQYARAGAQTTR